MKRQDENEKNEQGFPVLGILGGILALLAWVAALVWKEPLGPMSLLSFIALVFFGFIIFVFGYVPFEMARKEKDVVQKIFIILGVVFLHGSLIWYILLR